MKLMYKTEMTISHKLSNKLDLADKACLKMHTHKVKLIVYVAQTSVFLDFKDIKNGVEKYLNYNKVTMTMEEIVEDLRFKLALEFSRDVMVELWETDKYGVIG